MAIVRELLIKIGFISDKKAINATNNAITGFKTRFALAATAATYAISKIAGFFGDVAQAAIKADDLSKTLGISARELDALTKGLKKFRLNDSQIVSVLENVNQKFRDFRTGASNEIQKVAKGLKFEVDKNSGPLKFFADYLEALGKVQNETEAISLATEFFGKDLAPAIVRLSKDIPALNTAVTDALAKNQDIDNSKESVDGYVNAVNELNSAWSTFVTSLSTNVFPALTAIINYLTLISGLVTNVLNLDGSGIKNSLNGISKFFDPLFKATGLNHISDKFKKLYGGDSLLNSLNANSFSGFNDYIENKTGYRYQDSLAGGNSMTMSPITNNVEINVASGTELQQIDNISTAVQEAIRRGVLQTFSEIQNNNPVLE